MSQARRIVPVMILALGLGASACKSKAKKAPAAQTGAAAQTGSAAGSAAPAKPEIPPTIHGVGPQEAVDDPSRTAEDRALDAGRKPVELLNFLGIGRGMKVAEILAGGGYTAELLARVVGPEGMVYAENPKDILEKFAEKPWSERLARAKMPWLVRVDRELDDPLPPEAKDLDLVVMNLVYHDTVAMGLDRTGMNNAIWKALKPGGSLVIIDHVAAPGGDPAQVAKDLHRIEPTFVQTEVEQSGFSLAGTSNLYENKADTHDWSTSPGAAGDKRGTSDRFAMVFRKRTGK